MKIRINKFLSDAGVCSRRAADELIIKSKVFVNKKPAVLGIKIDPEKDVIEVNGQIVAQKKDEYVYYALNKPVGVVSTVKDEEGRKTVLDLVPKEPRVYPVGRLDRNSEGLIILTNDGGLTNELTHPRNEHEKEYIVIAKGSKRNAKSNEEIMQKMEKGIRIDGSLMKAYNVKMYSDALSLKPFTLSLVLRTGYNRQIRKMCAKMGLEIIKLKRIRISKLNLEELGIQPGEYKKVKKEDLF